jgi:beta-xylosidase
MLLPTGSVSASPAPPLRGAQLAEPGVVFPTQWIDRGDPLLVSTGAASYAFYWTEPLPDLNVPVQTKTGDSPWGPVGDALPALPGWAAPGATWAPDVHQFDDGWILYFSAELAGVTPEMHCIGDAVSDSPSGPYLAASRPFICQQAIGGSIDPRVFTSPGGTSYMVWKSDNNSRPGDGMPQIWSQRLGQTGTTLLGRPSDIYGPSLAWQHGLVEAPDLVFAGGRYWLFYSGGDGFSSTDYAIGDAACAGPRGPCTNESTRPLLFSNQQGRGPGEESLFVAGSADWLVYNPARTVNGSSPRSTAIARLGLDLSGPYLARA